MTEIWIILKAIGIVITIITGLVIIIPLSFYLEKKRKTSRFYRHLELSIFLILFLWWGHGLLKDDLLSFWVISIFGFILAHLVIWGGYQDGRKI